MGSLPLSSHLNTFLHAFVVQDAKKNFTVSGNPHITVVNSSSSFGGVALYDITEAVMFQIEISTDDIEVNIEQFGIHTEQI